MADIINETGLPLSPAAMKVQQDSIDRQRRIAEYLQQQSLSPDQGQMVSGHYVAPSATQYLAKLAQGLLGRTQQASLDKKQMGLVSQQDKAEERAFGIGGNTPQVQQSMPTQEPPSMPVGSGMSGLNSGAIVGNDKIASALMNNQEQAQAPTPQGVPSQQQGYGSRVIPGMDSYQALAAMRRDPKSYETAYLKQFEPTDTMKNAKWMGRTPEEMAMEARASGLKAGMLEMQPGNTVKNLATGGYEVAPDYKTGISGGRDAQGNPTMSKIAGSNAIAELAGDAKRAEAAGTAGYNMTKVDTPSGPVMMTAEQAAQLSGGGRQSPSPINFTSSTGVKLNFEGMTPQQLFDKISSIKDPLEKQDMSQAFNEWSKSGQQPVGIALQSDAAKEKEVGTEKMKLAVEEKRLKDLNDTTTKASKLYEQIKAAVPMAREYLKTATGSGVGAVADSAMNIIGKSTQGSNAAAQLDTLAGWMTSNVPRMEGPQSDKDALLYRQMAAQVGDRKIPNETRLKSLDTLEELQNKYAVINGVAPKSNIDDLLKKYGGK